MATTKKKKAPMKPQKALVSIESQFAEVAEIVRAGRYKAFASVNAAVIETYWRVGGYISKKVEKTEWGKGVVETLAEYLKRTVPDPRGFSARNLWRMKQFHDIYGGYEKLSTMLTQLPWSSHLHLISKTRTPEERDYYLQLAIQERYDVRTLEQAIDRGMFEQSRAKSAKLSTVLREKGNGFESRKELVEIFNNCGKFSYYIY